LLLRFPGRDLINELNTQDTSKSWTKTDVVYMCGIYEMLDCEYKVQLRNEMNQVQIDMAETMIDAVKTDTLKITEPNTK